MVRVGARCTYPSLCLKIYSSNFWLWLCKPQLESFIHFGQLDHGFPIWFDGKKLLFLVRRPVVPPHVYGYLYEYDSERKTYEKVDALLLDLNTTIILRHFFSFEPTWANVPKIVLPPYTVNSKHFPAITTILNEFRYLIANYKPRVERVPGRAVNKFPCINWKIKSLYINCHTR